MEEANDYIDSKDWSKADLFLHMLRCTLGMKIHRPQTFLSWCNVYLNGYRFQLKQSSSSIFFGDSQFVWDNLPAFLDECKSVYINPSVNFLCSLPSGLYEWSLSLIFGLTRVKVWHWRGDKIVHLFWGSLLPSTRHEKRKSEEIPTQSGNPPCTNKEEV